MITLDSSALIAALDTQDPHYEAVMSTVREERGELVVPVAVLSEVAYFVEQKLGQRTLIMLVEDLITGVLSLDCGERGWERVLSLVKRYDDMPLGLADAAVIACAEQHGGRVLTLDRRHFGVVEREGTIQVLP